MKILWVSNTIFPEACEKIGIPPPVFGGWMYSGAKALLETTPSIKLAVASLYRENSFQIIKQFDIYYYLIPQKGKNQVYDTSLEKYYCKVISDFTPDLVHIHGSEYPHSLASYNASKNLKVVLSIQGLVSSIVKYYMGGINPKTMKKNVTLRDIVRNDSLRHQQKRMFKRSYYETVLIKQVKNIIGRTSWDHSNTWAINPFSNYYFCNETLRQSFYTNNWSYDKCEKFSIFISQAHYPIKGLHQLILALVIVIRLFPKTKVFIAGNNFMHSSLLRKNGYSKYLNKLMLKHNVKDRFHFLGVLSEEEMANQFKKAHIFVNPSIIENSPNSVGEAQLIGTPCIASYVGGTMDMIEHGKTGLLYRFEEFAILAKHICELFNNTELCEKLSKNSKSKARKRHDKIKNAQILGKIYKTIIECDY